MFDTDVLRMAQAMLVRDVALARMTRLFPVPNPAAGTDVIVTVPGGAVWLPVAFCVTLVTSAVVANRDVAVQYDDGASMFFHAGQPSTIAASLTNQFIWVAGQGYESNHSTRLIAGLPSPPIPLVAGMRIRTATSALDAGDQFNTVQLLVTDLSEWGIQWFSRQVVGELSVVGD